MFEFKPRVGMAGILLFAVSMAFGFSSSLPAQENDEEILIQEAVFNLPLGYRITPGIIDFYNETARIVDFAWFAPGQFALALEITRGRILFEFDTSANSLSLPSSLRSRCEYFALGGDVLVSEAANLKAIANFYKKKTALAPDGDRALADNAALTSSLAPYADLFVIRAEQWLDDDSTPDLAVFFSNVQEVAEAAREANPNIQFQIWMGRDVDNDRLTVERLFRALSLLAGPESLDIGSFGLGRKDVWPDPEHGNNLLIQTQFFIRRLACSRPGTPARPLDFRAAAVGYSEILLTWTDASADEVGFLLLRGQTAGRPPARVEGPLPGVDADSRRDTVPAPGSYYYRLAAFNSQGLSFFSDLQAADTLGRRANLPPRYEAPPAVVVPRGVPLDLQLCASDPDGDPVSYSLSVRPAGMVIDPADGTISWLPSVAGRFSVSATVSDGQAGDFLWFEIEVLDNS